MSTQRGSSWEGGAWLGGSRRSCPLSRLIRPSTAKGRCVWAVQHETLPSAVMDVLKAFEASSLGESCMGNPCGNARCSHLRLGKKLLPFYNMQCGRYHACSSDSEQATVRLWRSGGFGFQAGAICRRNPISARLGTENAHGQRFGLRIKMRRWAAALVLIWLPSPYLWSMGARHLSQRAPATPNPALDHAKVLGRGRAGELCRRG